VRRVEGEGMPVHGFPSQRGTLFVKYVVDLPPALSQEQKDAVSRVF
jgi:DnaJ-class molecular chaperone